MPERDVAPAVRVDGFSAQDTLAAVRRVSLREGGRRRSERLLQEKLLDILEEYADDPTIVRARIYPMSADPVDVPAAKLVAYSKEHRRG